MALAFFGFLSLVLVLVTISPGAGIAADENTLQIGWLSYATKQSRSISYLDQPPPDEGIQGARLVVTDLAAPELLSFAGLSETGSATFFNTAARDDRLSNDISVIDVESSKVIKSIPVGQSPWGVVSRP